jgi:hypothetical protein
VSSDLCRVSETVGVGSMIQVRLRVNHICIHVHSFQFR